MDAYTEIVVLAGVPPVMGGGGRGQTATAAGLTGKGTSRQAALDDLIIKLRAEAKAKADSDDIVALAKAKAIVITSPIPEPVKAKAVRGPRACDVSCLFAHITTCVCQCEGANHQAGWMLFGQAMEQFEERMAGPKRKVGGRLCACGCGEQTKGGKFKQGHDRRFHARFMDDGNVELDRFFKDDDDAGLVLTPAGRKALAAARKAKAE